MILIEAINISSGGGVNLVVALINKLNKEKVPFMLIRNRKAVLPNLLEENEILVQNTSIFNRSKLVKTYIDQYQPTAILTFNFPLPFKAENIRVITDFQNLHLVNHYDSSAFSVKQRFLFFLKKKYLNFFYQNSDLYITPTSYINAQFKETYGNRIPCKTLSYFDKDTLEKLKEKFIQNKVEKIKNAFIYVSSPSDHKNHKTLLVAWELLNKENVNPILKLTLPLEDERSKPFLEKIEQLNSKGGKIINISEGGFMDYEEVIYHTYSCQFTIFPSLNETFGFGLVEGAIMGNQILVSDRPFAYQVIKPSLAFDPLDEKDIYSKVKKVIANEFTKTELVFKDESSLLIDKLSKVKPL